MVLRKVGRSGCSEGNLSISSPLTKVAVLTGVAEAVRRGYGWTCDPSGSSVFFSSKCKQLLPVYLLYKKKCLFLYFLCVIDGMVLSLVLSLSCWASCHNLWFLADGCSECFPEWKYHSGGSKAATLHRQPAPWCNKYFYPYTCSVFLYYCFYYCGVWVCVPKVHEINIS